MLALQPFNGAIEIGEMTFQLGLVSLVQDFAQLTPRHKTSIQKVPSEENGLRGTAFYGEFFSLAGNFLNRRRNYPRAGRPAKGDGGHDGEETMEILGLEPLREAPNRTIRDVLEMGHVINHQRNDAFANRPGDVDPSEQRFGQGRAGVLMARRNNACLAILDGVLGRRGFAEVMRENGEHPGDF